MSNELPNFITEKIAETYADYRHSHNLYKLLSSDEFKEIWLSALPSVRSEMAIDIKAGNLKGLRERIRSLDRDKLSGVSIHTLRPIAKRYAVIGFMRMSKEEIVRALDKKGYKHTEKKHG